jgi:signal transduction histidine kinase/ActR/RegA family two-component response regulator
MTQTAVAGPEEQDFIFSSLSPSLAQKRLALGVVLFLAIAFLIIAGPLSTLQLAPINAFIPVYATAMFVNDSITAILLFAHFSILRTRALLVLSSGYLFTALIVVPWMLTFPGVFAPSGLLGAGLHSTSWLYIVWHAGFPAFVIAYALLKDGDPTKRLWQGSVRVAILSSIAITAATVCAAAILVTVGQDLLPGLMVDTVHLSPLWSYAAGFAALLIVLAIAVLWVRRRTTLDLWLMAVMCAFVIEIGLISFPVPARYTVGWYGGRICGLVSGSLLLFVLLYEITTVYSRLHARLHSDLERSEAFLAQAQSISSTGSFGWNVLSGEIYWSEETHKIFELDRAAKPTLEWVLQRVHPHDLVLVRETIGCASREGVNFDLEHRLLTPDGRVKHLHVLARALKTSSGNLEFVGAVTDITERKRAEEEQTRLGQRLRQAEKMEAMGTLAGGIAHDFNNILGAILGYGELAQKTAAEGSVGRRYLDNVMQAGARAKLLVERILAFSRSGVTKRGPINVQAVIEEALELLAASLAPDIRLEKRLEAGDAAIVGDATQLHQVAMNLSTNASQAMEHGGVLEVTLDRAEVAQNRPLSHGNLAPGVYVRLCVNDTGSGIPPRVLDRMFDPFFTTKEPGEGTGLGLSLVQSIVADLGGAIDVRTSVGRGTSFTVWLPIAGEMAVLPAEVATQLPRGNGQSVMIVDDEKPLVGLAEEILAELGYEPIGFSSSTAALEAFRAAPQRFDIVLTDETMPEIIGTDLAREIALLRPDVPIVLMSGYGGAQLPSRARAAGIREILHKPLQRKDIAECLGRVLRSLPLPS